MVNKIHFGKRIAVLRRRTGLSQVDLAEKLGVTSQAVSKWECGNAVPDIDMLLELSHLYKVTINEMLEDADLLCELTGRETGRSGICQMKIGRPKRHGLSLKRSCRGLATGSKWRNELRLQMCAQKVRNYTQLNAIM